MTEHACDVNAVLAHVREIVFDDEQQPDPDCEVCQAGIATGAWRVFGWPDPVAGKTPDPKERDE